MSVIAQTLSKVCDLIAQDLREIGWDLPTA